jgi:hypothetical protein
LNAPRTRVRYIGGRIGGTSVELLFLLIFLLFIVLNVVIGLASSRAKRRRASQRAQGMEGAGRSPTIIGRDERQYRGQEPLEPEGEAPEYFLEPQTAESLVRSMSEAAREQERVHTEQLARAERETVVRNVMRDEAPDIADERAPLPGGAIEVGKQRAAAEAPAEAAPVPERPASPVLSSEPTEPTQVRTRLDVPEKESLSGLPKSPAETDDASRERPAARTGPAWRYVEQLPGLKRAVILSEILGRPRSLSDGSHTH